MKETKNSIDQSIYFDYNFREIHKDFKSIPAYIKRRAIYTMRKSIFYYLNMIDWDINKYNLESLYKLWKYSFEYMECGYLDLSPVESEFKIRLYDMLEKIYSKSPTKKQLDYISKHDKLIDIKEIKTLGEAQKYIKGIYKNNELESINS